MPATTWRSLHDVANLVSQDWQGCHGSNVTVYGKQRAQQQGTSKSKVISMPCCADLKHPDHTTDAPYRSLRGHRIALKCVCSIPARIITPLTMRADDICNLHDEVRKRPRKAEVHHALGLALLNQGSYRDASDCFRCT